MLDFEGAMDWLEREYKKVNPLVIDLTEPVKDGTTSNDTSTSSDHARDDSDYKDNVENAKPQHKKENSWHGNSPQNKNSNLNILSDVCGDIIEDKWSYMEDEIDVDEGNESHTFSPSDLFNDMVDQPECLRWRFHKNYSDREELEVDSGQDDILRGGGQKHWDTSGGLKGTHESEQTLQTPREGDQDYIVQSKDTVCEGQPNQDNSEGLEVGQEWQQLDSHDQSGEEAMSKSQRKRWRKRERKREQRKREQEEEQESGHTHPTDSTKKKAPVLDWTQQ